MNEASIQFTKDFIRTKKKAIQYTKWQIQMYKMQLKQREEELVDALQTLEMYEKEVEK